MDFGISKVLDGVSQKALTATATSIGTPYYMAPEQFRNSKDVDARVDQYALSVIVYECLTGTMPFEGDSIFELIRKIGEGGARPPSAVRPVL